MISAKIIADSISLQGIRICTLQLRYPKYIHAEFMTHRVFSRNASSSRAIPVEKLISDVQLDRVDPPVWFRNKPGMQGTDEITDETELDRVYGQWVTARAEAIRAAVSLTKLGAHKQHINRLLEPFCHINVVVTSTEWSNFFALRCHKDAQPEMRELAEKMRAAMNASAPIELQLHTWHVPYIDLLDREEALNFSIGTREPHEVYWNRLVKLSVARCARVSYLTHDGKKPDIERDLALYNQLVSSVPLHASPAEHQATPDGTYMTATEVRMHGSIYKNPHLHANFRGWIQYRKTLPGENQ